jgi:hypothetical protein
MVAHEDYKIAEDPQVEHVSDASKDLDTPTGEQEFELKINFAMWMAFLVSQFCYNLIIY